MIIAMLRNHAEALEALATSIRDDGHQALAFPADARDEDEMKELVERIEAEVGAIEVAIFNIGANVRFGINETTSRVYRKVWEMGCFAGFLMGREVAARMLPRKRGTIIFTGATASMILFIAGLSSIPQDLYDAAAVDGADGWVDRFLRVTWPMLGPTTMFVVVTTTITAFKVFDTVAVLTDGGPRGASEVLLFSIYLEGFEYFRIGYASALTVAFLTFILLFSIAQAWVIDRNVHYR